jgi:hypothetical protein
MKFKCEHIDKYPDAKPRDRIERMNNMHLSCDKVHENLNMHLLLQGSMRYPQAMKNPISLMNMILEHNCLFTFKEIYKGNYLEAVLMN